MLRLVRGLLNLFFILWLPSCAGFEFSMSGPSQEFQLDFGTGLPFSQGQWHGHRARMLWDTGSSFSVISHDLVATTAPQGTFQQGSNTLVLQGLSLTSPVFHDGGFSGLIGGEAFRHCLVVFNFAKHTILLSSLPLARYDTRNAHQFFFTLVGNRPLCRILIADQPYTALIDTGSVDVLTLQGLAARKLPPKAIRKTLALVPSENAFEKFHSRRVILSSAKVFGEQLNSPVVNLDGVSPHSVDAQGHQIDTKDPYQVVIGYGFLKTGILTLDYRTGVGFWVKNRPTP